jgi:ABC-type transport system involved in multi-copper enzyme maturation permease subunit
MTFLRALKFELIKNLRKKRTFWAFAAVTVLVGILLIAYMATRFDPVEEYMRHASRAQRGLANMAIDTFGNGLLFATLFMGLLSYALMPVLAVAFGGELISSEIQLGTLRTALTRPVTRLGFYTTKYAYAMIVTLGFVLFTAVLTYGLGVLFLGRGPLLVPAAMLGQAFARREAFPAMQVLSEQTATLRFFVAYLLVAMAVMTMTTLSFTLSTLVKHTGAAMIIAISTYFILHILAATPWLQSWRPYLFVTKMSYWLPVFQPDPPVGEIWGNIGYFAIYNAGLFIPGLLVFLRRDVQC